jgi:DNA-directed RNA polymerase subunit RPC12/RpoP
MSIQRCQSCTKPFKVWEHKLDMPGTKEKEQITCPYCGHIIERMCNGWWNTSSLSKEEQQSFFDGNLTVFD